MSQAVPFVQTYLSAVEQLVHAIETMKFAQLRVATDSTLVPSYFASGQARTDITATDLTNANTAITAIIAAYDAGTPTNKSRVLNSPWSSTAQGRTRFRSRRIASTISNVEAAGA